MRPIRTGLRGLGAVAVAGMLALAAPHTAAAEDKGGGQHGGGRPGKPKPAATQGAEAWGRNATGQLGIGTAGEERPRDTAVTVHIPEHVLSVAAGHDHGLALLTNGTVKAWGLNTSGQLGYGNPAGADTSQPEPGNVAGLGSVKAVAAGRAHSLALLGSGAVMTWGANDRGQLGDGTTVQRNRPVAVTALTGRKVTAIAAGADFSLALLADGTLRAWGDNTFGQLGTGTAGTAPEPTPVVVAGLTGVKIKAIDAGDTHSLAVTAAGGVKGWGSNQFGQVGNGNQVSPQPTPVDVLGLGGVRVKAVSGGSDFSLALLTNGRVKGWGANASGQLGDGTTTSPRLTPVDAVGLTGVKAISAGSAPAAAAGLGHSLAVAGNTVKAWGYNNYGQLGDGNLPVSSPVPVTVRTGLKDPKSVSAGMLFSLAS
ncbi:RCC1 domain-containing protein [Catellatospora sichuanensis]|uniref:RCC1 domain-containing protein n=1 Tax=Catellatospora sichuanensis TaxID=1969805 RepID=UPI001183BF05|nr:cell wall anchor protein [Catellatospora sichuanensis]